MGKFVQGILSQAGLKEIDCAGEPTARGGRFCSRSQPSSVYYWQNNFLKGKMSSFVESCYRNAESHSVFKFLFFFSIYYFIQLSPYAYVPRIFDLEFPTSLSPYIGHRFRDFQRMIIFVCAIYVKRILWWRRWDNKSNQRYLLCMSCIPSFQRLRRAIPCRNDSDRRKSRSKTKRHIYGNEKPTKNSIAVINSRILLTKTFANVALWTTKGFLPARSITGLHT